MKEELVSFEIAKLAKMQGFDLKTQYVWNNNYSVEYTISQSQDVPSNWNAGVHYSAPTLSILQKWLREKHHMVVEVRFISGVTRETAKYDYIIWSTKFKDDEIDYNVYEKYDSYEQALEEGLFEALKFL